MALWQGKPNKKSTGGRLVPSKGKRKFEIGREKQYTRLGKQSLKQYRTCGGNVKVEMKFGIRLSNDSFASDYEVCFGKNTRLPLGFVDHATPPSSLQDLFSGNTRFTWLDMDSYTFMIPPYILTDNNLTELASYGWNFMAELHIGQRT